MNEKVTGADVPHPQPSSVAPLRPPSPFAADRFARALLPTSGAWSQAAQGDAADLAPIARAETKAELAELIERMCSAMYVGDKSAISQRIVLGLDHVLPGALAEIVREGIHLTVRLNVRNEHGHRLMSSQREELQRALEADGRLSVEVVVQTIHGAMEEDRG